jgi:hypothetical protein
MQMRTRGKRLEVKAIEIEQVWKRNEPMIESCATPCAGANSAIVDSAYTGKTGAKIAA